MKHTKPDVQAIKCWFLFLVPLCIRFVPKRISTNMNIHPRPDNPPSSDGLSANVLKALESVVSVRTGIPDDAMTAGG